MDTIQVKFIDVGRDKKFWTEAIPFHDGRINVDAMIQSIRRHGGLMSRDIAVDECGVIFVGGFRAVGRFEVVTNARSCQHCGNEIPNKVASNGTLAYKSRSRSSKYCDRNCMAAAFAAKSLADAATRKGAVKRGTPVS